MRNYDIARVAAVALAVGSMAFGLIGCSKNAANTSDDGALRSQFKPATPPSNIGQLMEDSRKQAAARYGQSASK